MKLNYKIIKIAGRNVKSEFWNDKGELLEPSDNWRTTEYVSEKVKRIIENTNRFYDNYLKVSQSN